MARAVLEFSKDGRARLAGVLRALLIGQLVVSLGMVIFTYNVSMKVMLLLKNIHKVTVILLYGLILLQAYAMKLHYTGGLRLVALMLKAPHWSRISRYSIKWMTSGTLLPVNGLLVYAACRSTMKTLTQELSVSLCYGISQYLTEPFWKRLMDTMQVELSCCGAEMPADWHEIPWINVDFLNEDSDLVTRMAGADGKVMPPVSPYSCCSPHVLAACYHDPLQQAEWAALWTAWAPLPPASLHARGCVHAARTPLARALLGLHCFSMLVVLLQAVILVVFQLLRTSARDAVLRGSARGEGRARLLAAPRAHHQKPADDGAGAGPGEGVRTDGMAESSAYAAAVSLQRRKRRRKPRRRDTYSCLTHATPA